MEKKTLKRLPVGIQTFSEVIDLDCLYMICCILTRLSVYGT